MIEENEWEQTVETDVEDRWKKWLAMKLWKQCKSTISGKAAGPSQINVEMIVESGKIGVNVMKGLYQRVLDGRGMLDERKTSVIV